MKVIAINGSPHKNGNTAYALNVVGKTLQEEGFDFEIVEAGGKHIRGCLACNNCFEMQNGQCVTTKDIVNETLLKMKEADGIILASPVYYSGIAGTMKCFLDRAFYVAASNGGWFRHKVGASVVAVRRTGGSMTFNALNHYLSISEMLVPTSNYWNVIHGLEPGDAAHDAEGNQIMQVLGKNMAWMLKMKEQTKDLEPKADEKVFTNFIR
ncbi:MAG: flavodoxin family protein [Tannerella sp.]|jgi:multimeric flavodoxin WrbA|nr:flavodoxin family protein [Tannerella sp.]